MRPKEALEEMEARKAMVAAKRQDGDAEDDDTRQKGYERFTR